MSGTPKPDLSTRRPVVVVVIVLTLFSGIVHGVIDGRWASSPDKRASAERFSELPKTLGEWELAEESQLDASAEKILRPYGSLVRHYRHVPTGTVVNFALLYGRRGPIAVHRPEVCYSSVGTRQTRQRSIESVKTDAHNNTLWSVGFTRNETGEKFDVWYGWSKGGEFVAADSPRFWLTEDLYKLQLSGPSSQAGFDPCESFVEELLPQLEQLVQ